MKNKRIYIGATLLSVLLILAGCSEEPAWELVWQDNFNGTELDENIWSRIPRAKTAGFKYMSDNEKCYELRNGILVLKGIVNEDMEGDTAKFLTGGVYTKHKKTFAPGRIEIRARLGCAQGAWPALWTCGDGAKWPYGGEIDIMEHLNYDEYVHQTSHSAYTHYRGLKKNPPQHAEGAIRPGEFNIYRVDIWPDSLVYYVNDIRTYAYPKVETGFDDQFPYFRPQFLIMDMQLGGNWVGNVKPEDLPVEMEIDWVRHYIWNNNESKH